MRLLRGTVVIVLSLLAVGCGGSTPTDPEPVYPQKTEVFSGSLELLGKSPFPFTVENPGSIQVAITSLTPVAAVMGLRLGGWDVTTSVCNSQLETTQATVNAVFSGTPNAPGQYCVEIFDLGNLQSASDFTVTLTHY
jgi:hypothetical protein